RMSALGQKRTSHQVRVMSASPPKADIGAQSRNVCFVPKADIGLLAHVPTVECGLRKPPFERAHWGSATKGPLCANSGHRPLYVGGPAAITKGNNKKRFDPAPCDSPELIEPELIELSP